MHLVFISFLGLLKARILHTFGGVILLSVELKALKSLSRVEYTIFSVRIEFLGGNRDAILQEGKVNKRPASNKCPAPLPPEKAKVHKRTKRSVFICVLAYLIS